MSKVFLTNSTAAWNPDRVAQRPVCVVHPQYACPRALASAHVDYKEFLNNTRRVISGADTVYLVGLTKMVTPSNRTKMAWEVIFNNTPNIPKVVVDHVLFRVNPWRVVFMFNAVGERYLDYTYSYIAESHYNSYCDGYNEVNPFSLETTLAQGQELVHSDYKRYFNDIDTIVVPQSGAVHAKYQRLKKRCFDEETTHNRIIKRLSGFAQEHCPERSVPDINRLWDKAGHQIVATDLGVDKWLVSQVELLAGFTNDLLRGFCNG